MRIEPLALEVFFLPPPDDRVSHIAVCGLFRKPPLAAFLVGGGFFQRHPGRPITEAHRSAPDDPVRRSAAMPARSSRRITVACDSASRSAKRLISAANACDTRTITGCLCVEGGVAMDGIAPLRNRVKDFPPGEERPLQRRKGRTPHKADHGILLCRVKRRPFSADEKEPLVYRTGACWNDAAQAGFSVHVS
jgi:hypothetical protein